MKRASARPESTFIYVRQLPVLPCVRAVPAGLGPCDHPTRHCRAGLSHAVPSALQLDWNLNAIQLRIPALRLSSLEEAEGESPACKCRVRGKARYESRRDGIR